MANFIRPWDIVKDEVQNEQVPQNKSLFENLKQTLGAWDTQSDILDYADKMHDIEESVYSNPNMSEEEFAKYRNEYVDLANKREVSQRAFDEVNEDLRRQKSELADWTQGGGTYDSMARKLKYGGGAFLTGSAIGSPLLGDLAYRAVSVPVDLYNSYRDAKGATIDAKEKALRNGATYDQAREIYYNTLPKEMLTTVPSTALDIAIDVGLGAAGRGLIEGSKIGGKFVGSQLGKKILNSSAAKLASKIPTFSPAESLATKVAQATSSPVLGRIAGTGLTTLVGMGTEGVQETGQDYIGETETAKVLGQPNSEYSIGGYLDYLNTPEGRETFRTSAKMGGLFTGVTSGIQSNQFMKLGTAHSDSIQAAKQEAAWIEKNKILENEGNKERFNEVKQTMGNIYDLTDEETEALSVEDVARMYHEYYANLYGVGGNRAEQSAVTQADLINEITGEETTRRGLMGDTATKYVDEFALRPDNETLRSMSEIQNEQLQQEEQVQNAINQEEGTTVEGEKTGIVAKGKEGFFTNDTKESAKQEGQVQRKKIKGAIPESIGKNWEWINEGEDFDYDVERKFRNKQTGRVANVKKVNGGYTVQDITDPKQETQTIVRGHINDVKKFLNSPRANRQTAFQSDGTQEQVSQALPKEDGVISSKDITTDKEGNQWFNGRKLQSKDAVTVHSMQDLHNYYKEHKDVMSKDLYAEVSRQMMRFGIGTSNNTDIVLDLSNKEAGGFGSKTTTLVNQNDPNSAIASAVVRLYAGADLATAAHEIAHLGWINLSEQDKATFAKWATQTEGKFIAQVLGMNYDQNFRSYLIEALTNKGQGGSATSQALWANIKSQGAVMQTLDLLNGGLDASQHEAAIDERFAWEFSNWYAQGYIKGAKPRNIIERILSKACATLQGALNLLEDTNRYLNDENGYNGGEVSDIFSRISTKRKDVGQVQQTPQEQVELHTEMTQPITEQPYNLNQGFNEQTETENYLDSAPQTQNLSRNTGTIGSQTYTTKEVEKKPQQDLSNNTGDVAKIAKTEGVTKKPIKYTPAPTVDQRVEQMNSGLTNPYLDIDKTQTSPVYENPAPSADENYAMDVMKNAEKTEGLEAMQKREAAEREKAEKAARAEAEKKSKAREKEKRDKLNALNKEVKSKVATANKSLNAKKKPSIEEIENQISEAENALSTYKNEEYSSRMINNPNENISQQDQKAFNEYQHAIDALRKGLNDLKQSQEQNKSVEKVDLTSDNQNATKSEPVVAENKTTENEKNNKEQVRKAMEQQMLLNREIDDIKGDHSDGKISYEEALNKFNEIEKKINSLKFPDSEQGRINNLLDNLKFARDIAESDNRRLHPEIEQAEKQKKIEEENKEYNGFLDNMSPMTRGKTIKQLSQKRNYGKDGGIMTKKAFIEKEVKNDSVFLQYITGDGYYLQYEDGTQRKIQQTDAEYYQHLSNQIREKEEAEKEQKRQEKRKDMPEDRWSKYRNKDGNIESDSEGVHHYNGDEIESPIFDVYDDPDSVSDAKDYIDALVSYDPSGTLLSNLKRKINDYQNTKNPVGEVEYWDDAIEAIEEEQENRRDNDGYVSADDNSSPWTSRMIMDNMKEHAEYLQKQNEEESEAEEQTSPETKTTTEAKPKTTAPETQTSTEPTTETKQATQVDKSDKKYQRAVELVLNNRGMSPVGLRLALEQEGINVGYVGAEKYLTQMEEDGLVEGAGEGSMRIPIDTTKANKKTKRGNNPDTRFQEAGQNAENQTLLTPEVEDTLEKIFWKLIRKKQFHGMEGRWASGSLDWYKSITTTRSGKHLNPEYVQNDKAYLTAIKNINDYIHEHYPQYKNLYRGADGHWRFEFSDKDAKFINGFEKLEGKELDTTLEKVLKHDALYKFYPKLKEMPLHLVRNEEMQRELEDYEHDYYAMYDPTTKSIFVNSDMFNEDDVRNSLLHEIQHAIQDIEGFANGTNDSAYNNDYDFSEGEKSAVLTEERSNMSDEELQQNPRYKTLNTEEKTVIEEQRPAKRIAAKSDTKMQSNGQVPLGYIDKQKDIYSVTFTKSAQQNAENKKKMTFYRANKPYWRENKDAQTGSITFTRALPYQQHQKTIIYDDINGKTVGKRKKSKVKEYIEAVKDQIIKWLFNDKHFLKKAARNVGAIESYMRMMVMKDQGAVAGAAIEDGIVKHNGKNGERTKSLNSIIEAVGEENQSEFLNYCEAFRVLDLAKRNIYQKMDVAKANDIIAKIQKSKNAKLFEEQRKNFVEYNHELLYVLVDGGFITEEQYDKFIKNDPNFIPLAKNMDELEGYVDGFRDSKTMINVAHPMHKIGTSMREVANPFLEMQKRTVEYYVKASRNKAGRIFVHDIAEAVAQSAGGNVVAKNQGMIRKLASRGRDGKPISHDNKQYVFYVWENGEKQYYQVADREIYVALKSFDAEQMGALSKIMNQTAGRASRLVRNTATMTPDFGLRNLVRDNVEAFISSEHGFIPLIDSLWGMYQMANDTQWFKEYQALNGEHLSLNRDGEDVATVEHDIKDNVKFYKNIIPLIKKDFREFTDKNRSVPARLKSLLKLVAFDVIPLQALYKGNKRLNDYLETGTRIGEYRNARMGYRGLYGRLFEGKGNTVFTNDNDLKMAQTDKMFAAYKAKDITLNFGQHGALGKELNRYIPFFNASLQGIYKVCNTLENMVKADDARLRQELWFKFVLMGAMGMAAAVAGHGDDDYDEAPDYEHDNFWVFSNGFRIPKDQLFGRLVGGTVEKATRQYLKDGDVKKLELLKDILGNFVIDKSVPALVDLAWGTVGNYDSFMGQSVTPEYMANRWGYLQKDLSTSKIASDISEGMLNVLGIDVGAKKVDFVLSKTLSNLGNYAKNLYELGTNPNERMTRGAEPEDKGGFAEWSKELPYPMNTVVGTFATNRNTFQSLSDFYNRYKELQKFESAPERMSKAEKKVWEAYKKAYKDDKRHRDALKAIKTDKSLTGAQKRERADKIFKQQIKMARKLRDYEKK